MTLQNKKIVVAGGTSGIGLAAAQLFKEAGASVTITGRNAEKLNAAKQEGWQTAQVNSSDITALETFFKTQGKFDHLIVAVSGAKGAGNFAELSLHDLREGFEAKYWSQINTLKAALPFVNNEGSITLVTAASASGKLPGTSGLAAINGALEIMVPVLAKELKPLRINAVSPGVVDTDWWNFLPEQEKKSAFEHFASQTSVGRIAQPNEIAQAILFLTENKYMTGKIIVCDGGLV